ncbi:MAG: PAC2 family protein [Planctomycetes bacterium]|nr:PAC2 family protein [Planctomycetota bacterium]
MPQEMKLHRPWLVAVWPGMGNVAISAGYYLMAKLGMHAFAEMAAGELFDVEHVEVKDGLIRAGRLPRSRFFVWRDPGEQRDLVVFIGEAQPPMGRYAFCRRLIEYAEELGVEQVFTFAAMATQMRPEHESRVFGAATDRETLDKLRQQELTILEEGHIGGLNGVLLGAAAERKLRGACLLGEMPSVFAQLPFPKASLSVLNVFTAMADVTIDLSELAEQAEAMEQQLGELLLRVQHAVEEDEEEESFAIEPDEEDRLSPEEERRIERLFSQAQEDRAKAYELKQVLDQLGVFADYEDRFLDLFKTP